MKLKVNGRNPSIQLERKVLSLKNELNGNYKLTFDNPKSNELYQKAVQQEYETLKPAYDEVQPGIKTLSEENDKNMYWGAGFTGLMIVSLFGFLAPAILSKKEED